MPKNVLNEPIHTNPGLTFPLEWTTRRYFGYKFKISIPFYSNTLVRCEGIFRWYVFNSILLRRCEFFQPVTTVRHANWGRCAHSSCENSLAGSQPIEHLTSQKWTSLNGTDHLSQFYWVFIVVVSGSVIAKYFSFSWISSPNPFTDFSIISNSWQFKPKLIWQFELIQGWNSRLGSHNWRYSNWVDFVDRFELRWIGIDIREFQPNLLLKWTLRILLWLEEARRR